MQYQLVIQFPELFFDDLDEIAELEDRLDASLLDAECDGHDIGSGEVNIFIHTNKPMETYEILKHILEKEHIDRKIIKIAYREIEKDHFICLFPEDLKDFKLM